MMLRRVGFGLVPSWTFCLVAQVALVTLVVLVALVALVALVPGVALVALVPEVVLDGFSFPGATGCTLWVRTGVARSRLDGIAHRLPRSRCLPDGEEEVSEHGGVFMCCLGGGGEVCTLWVRYLPVSTLVLDRRDGNTR